MSETTADLQRKINSATDLASVVRTMKALAASRIGEFQNTALSLKDYYRTIELGLLACLQSQRNSKSDAPPIFNSGKSKENSIIVVGSDQGLIGQFNETLISFVTKTLGKIPGINRTFVVGERIIPGLEATGMSITKTYQVPNSVLGITPLICELLVDSETGLSNKGTIPLFIFYNHPLEGASYEPCYKRLLPLDKSWEQKYYKMKWPAKNIPEVMGDRNLVLGALVKEFLFVSLFRACAESMASENASRLAAMQRAEKNINTILEEMNQSFHRLRQDKIDEELFDVISGFNSIK